MSQSNKAPCFAVLIRRTLQLDLDVPDILNILDLDRSKLYWVANIEEWGGYEDAFERAGLAAHVTESGLENAVISTDELLALFAPGFLHQIVDGTFRAYPIDVDRVQAVRDEEPFPNSPAVLDIRGIDATFFAVATRDYHDIEALRRRFPHATDEDPENF